MFLFTQLVITNLKNSRIFAPLDVRGLLFIFKKNNWLIINRIPFNYTPFDGS